MALFEADARVDDHIDVDVGPLIDSWIYEVEGKRVLILTYSCSAERPHVLGHSDEHAAVAELTRAELRTEPIPEGYLRSIEANYARSGEDR